jgi:hypothetical protein
MVSRRSTNLIPEKKLKVWIFGRKEKTNELNILVNIRVTRLSWSDSLILRSDWFVAATAPVASKAVKSNHKLSSIFTMAMS